MNYTNLILYGLTYFSVSFALSNALFTNIFEKKDIFSSVISFIAFAAFFYHVYTQ